MTSTPTRPRPRFRLRAWMVLAVLGLAVVVFAAMSVKVVSIEEAASAEQGDFDPAEYAAERYDDIAAYVEDNAIELPALLTQLEGGADEAELGNTSGASSAYAFPVTFTAVAGAVTPPVLPVTVEGLPEGTVVQVQVGPALNGTALRDVSGTVSFNEFTNQLEYQQVATELNNRVREEVLAEFDAAAAGGRTVTVTGAFLRVNPQLVSVVPVSIEVQP
jgi:predicted lipoprotein